MDKKDLKQKVKDLRKKLAKVKSSSKIDQLKFGLCQQEARK